MKTAILTIFEATSTQLAEVRSILSGKLTVYIEIENTFFIQSEVEGVVELKNKFNELTIKFIFVYISERTGNWVDTKGINPTDIRTIRQLINPDYVYSP